MLTSDDKKIQWYKEARFGLFIHWGLYAATEGYWNGKETPGIGEWIAAKESIPTAEYEKLAGKMTCDKFSASEWAKLAKDAGMRYCVFTAKHHEGFAMYDTGYDDYSIVKRSPYGKDIAGEIADAMRAEGIKPCFYYSQAIDFHEKNAMGNTWDNPVPEAERDFKSYINGKCKEQLKELLTGYGDIGLIWMDVPKGMTEEIALDLKAHVKKYQPDCLVSGRIGGTEDMGDYGCLGDNQIPAGKLEGCWETASTMNGTWGYKRDDHDFKSPKEIIELLCGLMSKGANLLLNIGPKANGEIPEESIHILKELAKWHEVNGEAVNGTEASPFECDFTFGGASCKENAIYLYVYDKTDEINIYGIENEIKNICVLGGGNLNFTHGGVLHIDTMDINFGEYVTVIKIELDKEPKIKKGVYSQERDIVLPAAVCKVIKNTDEKTSQTLTGDAAVEAENFNLDTGEGMAVTVAGVVEMWYSDKNHIEWEFEAVNSGEYDAYLYTLTEKYETWKGGHEVHIEGDAVTKPIVLTADKASKGANKKYFDETGSKLGTIALKAGKNKLRLIADKINQSDKAGLCVTKLILLKN